ncbi:hypothetical protein ES702_01805 [subsurface metagenome]
MRYRTNKSLSVNHSWSLQPKLYVPINGLLGNLLISADDRHNAMASPRTYKLRYPRNISTHFRICKAIEILRYRYRYSMNNIAFGLQISTRTVQRRIKDLYEMGFKAFNCMRNRLYRSKNPSMMRTLRAISARIQSYIDGQISLLQLYSALELRPP